MFSQSGKIQSWLPLHFPPAALNLVILDCKYIAVAGFASPFLADVIGQVFHPDDCVNAVGEEEVIVLGVHVDFKRSGIVPVIEFNEQEHCFDEAALVLAGCRIGMGQILGDTPGIVAEIDETVHGIAVRDDMAVAVEFSGIIGWV